MEEYLQVGIITSPHGVKGEVKVFPTTDDNKRFKKLKECFLEQGNQKISVKVKSAKFNKDMVILGFEGMDNRNDVEKLRKCAIYVDREHAVSLEKDEYFVADLCGLEVFYEDGQLVGTLSDVLHTGANDVYIVETPEGEEILYPAISDYILSVDMNERRIVVNPIEYTK